MEYSRVVYFDTTSPPHHARSVASDLIKGGIILKWVARGLPSGIFAYEWVTTRFPRAGYRNSDESLIELIRPIAQTFFLPASGYGIKATFRILEFHCS